MIEIAVIAVATYVIIVNFIDSWKLSKYHEAVYMYKALQGKFELIEQDRDYFIESNRKLHKENQDLTQRLDKALNGLSLISKNLTPDIHHEIADTIKKDIESWKTSQE
jgi:predicted nuclease with TOPRIM domain